jgi:hypothetical protein
MLCGTHTGTPAARDPAYGAAAPGPATAAQMHSAIPNAANSPPSLVGCFTEYSRFDDREPSGTRTTPTLPISWDYWPVEENGIEDGGAVTVTDSFHLLKTTLPRPPFVRAEVSLTGSGLPLERM